VGAKGVSRETISYRALRAWARSAIAVFYRSVEVTNANNVDQAAPTIFAVNHQSALGDVAVLVAVRPELPHFLAASTWWKRAPARLLFRLGGVVPVYRNGDGSGTRRNASSFEACHAALADGAHLAIFPEGEMNDGRALLPIKTGVARIALGAAAEAGVAGVRVVPVGLVYESMGRFRSDVEVVFGAPIEIDKWLDAYRANHHQTVRELTEVLRDALADAAVDRATARDDLFDRAASMTVSDTPASFADRNAVRRALRSGYDAPLEELEQAVRAHARNLDALPLADDDPLEPLSDVERTRLQSELALLAAPAALGAIANAPAILGTWAASTRAPDVGWQATVKGVSGTFLLPLTWIGEWAWLSKRFGRRGAAAAVTIGAACGWATLGHHDRSRRLRRATRTARVQREQPAALEAARMSRADLRKRVEAMIGDAR
jgi:1-acyl-sn-glycerol-3-phosphate acyltransferase